MLKRWNKYAVFCIYVECSWHPLCCRFAAGWRHRLSGKSLPWSSVTATPTSSSCMKSSTIRWGWRRRFAVWRLQENMIWDWKRTNEWGILNPPVSLWLLLDCNSSFFFFFKPQLNKHLAFFFICVANDAACAAQVCFKRRLGYGGKCGWLLAGSLALTLQIKEHHFSLMSSAGLLLYLRDLWPRSAQSSFCFTDPALMRRSSVAQACYFISPLYLPPVAWCNYDLISKHLISVLFAPNVYWE